MINMVKSRIIREGQDIPLTVFAHRLLIKNTIVNTPYEIKVFLTQKGLIKIIELMEWEEELGITMTENDTLLELVKP